MTGSVETATASDAQAADRASIAFAHFRGSGWRGEFIADSPLHKWLLAGGSPERIEVPSEWIVRDGSRSRCARIDRLDEAHPLPVPLFFKAYRRRPGTQAALKRVIGWHMPSWVWRMSWRLLEFGVAVPKPYGYLSPMPLRPHRCAYCWTEWIEGARHAKDFGNNAAMRHVVESEFYLRGSAEILGRLHNAGVYHRDMNWGNLLLDPPTNRIWLVDLDSAHRWTWNPRRSASRDVARFLLDAVRYEMTPEWREAFIEGYADVRRISLQNLKRWVAPVIQTLMSRRQQKRERQVAHDQRGPR